METRTIATIFKSNLNKWISNSDIQYYYNQITNLKMTSIIVRKNIQRIREANEKYFDGMYIIASNKGYKLTDYESEIRSYSNSIITRRESLILQLEQLEKTCLLFDE